MKKSEYRRSIAGILGAFFVAMLLFSLAGCPTFEDAEIDGIRIFLGGTETTALTIQEGQTLTLRADIGIAPGFASIVWEVENSSVVEIIGTGYGATNTVRAGGAGETVITVKAWRDRGNPETASLPVEVIPPEISDINLIALPVVGVGERRVLLAEVVPAWARQELEWEAYPSGMVSLEESGGAWFVEGTCAGTVRLTATAYDGFSRWFDLDVVNPDELASLDIYWEGSRITGETIELALFEERSLTAMVAPANAQTFFRWSSSDGGNVLVYDNGVIRSRVADSLERITVRASGREAYVYVRVGDPVTGIRVQYDNSEMLPVSNTVWLYPGDSVDLRVFLYPARHTNDAEILWTLDGVGVELSNLSGLTSTVTGVTSSPFDSPPIVIRVDARNDDNGTGTVTALVRVKVLEEPPIWAWDRGRDADINSALLGLPELSSGANLDNAWRIIGRGQYGGGRMINAALGNPILYAPSGLILNSSNNNCGTNPSPAPTPGNSTRIMIGSNTSTATTNIAGQPGVFDFYAINRPIRVSVDYEILWTAGAGRNMWIMLNGNQANTNSPLRTLSQPLIQPLTAPRGTRATASVVINVPEWIQTRITGWESLKESFVGIVALSNGGSISVSGIRIEVAEEVYDGGGGE